MDENKKKILFWVGLAVVAVIVIYAVWSLGDNLGDNNGGGGQNAGGVSGGGTKSTTRQPVASTVAVPDATSAVAENIAKPTNVVPAAPGS